MKEQKEAFTVPGKEPCHRECILSRAGAEHEKNRPEDTRSKRDKVRGCVFRGVRGGALRGRSLRRA